MLFAYVYCLAIVRLKLSTEDQELCMDSLWRCGLGLAQLPGTSAVYR
jgi:hypothetical protein